MDDRNINMNDEKNLYNETKKSRWSFLKYFLPSKSTTNRSSSSSNVTCLSILKEIFHHPSKSLNRHVDYGTNILTY
jgi:hypothetical protein